MPKELQDGPALHDSHMQRASGLNEAGQGQMKLQEPEGQAKQPEIQECQEVGLMCGTLLLPHPTLCCAMLWRAVLCCAMLRYAMLRYSKQQRAPGLPYALLACSLHIKDCTSCAMLVREGLAVLFGHPTLLADRRLAEAICTHVLMFA